MKRIALITLVTASAAVLGVVKPTLAETTVPMSDLALVSETSAAADSPVGKIEPVAYPRFQYPRFQYPRFQFPRFQYPRFQFPRFQFPRFQYPRHRVIY